MVEDAFLEEVMKHFRGPRRIIWEMIMGEDIHMGGVEDTRILAEKIGINRKQGSGCRMRPRWIGAIPGEDLRVSGDGD